MPTMTLVSKKIQWNKYYSLKDLLDWKHASIKYTMIRYSRGKTIFFTFIDLHQIWYICICLWFYLYLYWDVWTFITFSGYYSHYTATSL